MDINSQGLSLGAMLCERFEQPLDRGVKDLGRKMSWDRGRMGQDDMCFHSQEASKIWEDVDTESLVSHKAASFLNL